MRTEQRSRGGVYSIDVTDLDRSSMGEADLREENSGLWFSPAPPEDPRVQDGRNPDSVLFNLATVAAATAAAPVVALAAPRTPARNGSGFIDVRTLAAAASDPNGAPQPLAPPIALLPTLVQVTTSNVAQPSAPPRLLYAMIGLLGIMLVLLAWFAAR